ncbi:hypothetical protein KKP04_04885 [Rhodomicrobium sp. Az07]|uniref:hypothetical protein n=1 Tax=Rhodomicrobium sp. Az07 TaxID=2839034 RepID=UPI001BE6008C|nr:hypothetical protein [Rhodomicrobium sp. Az07]MBT3070203.1 hypothetical protein [Rhodomicrobium sp. Az07]
MTFAQGGEISLEVDLGGTGVFVPVGRLFQPSLALTSALRELDREQTQGERHGVLLYTFATRISGECAVANETMLRGLKEACAASVALEWRIAVPALGAVRALFAVATLEETANAGSFRMTLQLAGQPALETFCCDNKC